MRSVDFIEYNVELIPHDVSFLTPSRLLYTLSFRSVFQA